MHDSPKVLVEVGSYCQKRLTKVHRCGLHAMPQLYMNKNQSLEWGLCSDTGPEMGPLQCLRSPPRLDNLFRRIWRSCWIGGYALWWGFTLIWRLAQMSQVKWVPREFSSIALKFSINIVFRIRLRSTLRPLFFFLNLATFVRLDNIEVRESDIVWHSTHLDHRFYTKKCHHKWTISQLTTLPKKGWGVISSPLFT